MAPTTAGRIAGGGPCRGGTTKNNAAAGRRGCRGGGVGHARPTDQRGGAGRAGTAPPRGTPRRHQPPARHTQQAVHHSLPQSTTTGNASSQRSTTGGGGEYNGQAEEQRGTIGRPARRHRRPPPPPPPPRPPINPQPARGGGSAAAPPPPTPSPPAPPRRQHRQQHAAPKPPAAPRGEREKQKKNRGGSGGRRQPHAVSARPRRAGGEDDASLPNRGEAGHAPPKQADGGGSHPTNRATAPRAGGVVHSHHPAGGAMTLATHGRERRHVTAAACAGWLPTQTRCDAPTPLTGRRHDADWPMCARTRARERRPAPDWPATQCPRGGVWGGGDEGRRSPPTWPCGERARLWGGVAASAGPQAKRARLALLGGDVKKKNRKRTTAGPRDSPCLPARCASRAAGWAPSAVSSAFGRNTASSRSARSRPSRAARPDVSLIRSITSRSSCKHCLFTFHSIGRRG